MILPYQPYFCEENAYRICEMLGSPDSAGVRRMLEDQAPAPAAGPVDVAGPPDTGGVRNAAAMVFIFSRGPWVTLYHQRAVAPGRPIYWDYHVIAIVREADTWRVFDPDSRLDAGIDLARYLEETFTGTGPRRAGAEDKRDGATGPLFRCIPWETARTAFGSDRSHMRTPDGEWIQPPPTWPPINPEQHTLPAFLSRHENGVGQLYSLVQLTGSGLGATLKFMWSAEQTREAARRRLAREAERERELAARRAEARKHGEELARKIAEQDRSVTKIVGFGSAFDDRLPFTFFSDIDLAVAGGTITGWKISEQSPWKVDFVELEHQDQAMVDAILASGVVLYERS